MVDLDADVVHVFREETAAFHLPEPDCPCGPELQLRDRGNGQVGTGSKL